MRVFGPLQHQHLDAGEAQLASQKQTDRPGAGNDDVINHGNSFSARAPKMYSKKMEYADTKQHAALAAALCPAGRLREASDGGRATSIGNCAYCTSVMVDKKTRGVKPSA
ncbi:hypothetical protein RugamoR57_57200 [Duganella caerulea]